NSLLSLLLAVVLIKLVVSFIDWAFIEAVWRPDAKACRAAAGACWGFIADKHRFILFGTYPYEEHWRPAVATLLLVALWVLSGFRYFWKPILIAIWAIGLAAIGVLMWG